MMFVLIFLALLVVSTFYYIMLISLLDITRVIFSMSGMYRVFLTILSLIAYIFLFILFINMLNMEAPSYHYSENNNVDSVFNDYEYYKNSEACPSYSVYHEYYERMLEEMAEDQ